MRPIDPALLDEVWREITAYPPARVEEEAAAFLARQPDVARFCHTVTKQFDESVQRAAVGLAFLLFKILEASLGVPFPSVARERVTEAYEATTAWLEGWEGVEPQIFLRDVLDAAASPHPNLTQHLLTLFYGSDPLSGKYDAEVVAALYLMLKTLTDALDIAPAE